MPNPVVIAVQLLVLGILTVLFGILIAEAFALRKRKNVKED